ncbi:GNAT family N-acetyltransferase [Pontibacter sp. G13]|uniref:GNAT family N-acetyltransferase n=1 Tax=Pontibacter sp. G13 TaxID=3074898 RepID=UPI0028898445|nr:GNAT family N-acetyltransferase [Pontibacter sp. G13]WNJ19327.1 GNAT family N-acetyltransferase [Pontibacter sp. G13]
MSTSTMAPVIRVERVETDTQFNHVFDIRTSVFVNESSIDQEDEYDGFDFLSNHYLAYYDNVPAGTARWRMVPGSGKVRLERFAVSKEYRSKGIGKALMDALLEEIPKNKEIFIHVQTHNVPYYERFGFVTEGETFEEAGIEHQKLVYQPQP